MDGADALLIAAAYFAGAVPSGYLYSLLFAKKDIRHMGSGNVGAMNVLKQVGVIPGILTACTDLAKGAMPAWTAVLWGSTTTVPFFAVLAVVLGHNYSVFLQFSGGKGFASLGGALLFISPIVLGITFGCIAVTTAVMADVKAGPGVGIISFPVAVWFTAKQPAAVMISAAVAVLILIKHRRDFAAYWHKRKETGKQ